MSELMLVNPRRRRRRATPRRNARGEFVRKNPRRRRRRTVRHHRAYTRRERGHVERVRANPRRRRRSHTRVRRRTHLRRNPRRAFNARGFINSTLIPAGVGALGALSVDVVIGYASPHLPAVLQSGMMQNVVKIAAAVGVGYVAGMVAGKKFGEEAMAGAITVTLADIVKGYAQSAMPSLPLSGYDMGWVSPAYQLPGGMGMYVGSDNAYSGQMGMYVGENDEAQYAY